MQEHVWNLTIGGVTNPYKLKMPTIRDIWAIEQLKFSALGSSYKSMGASVAHVSANVAADHADVGAYVTVLAPEILLDLGAEEYGELGVKHATEIYKQFYSEESGVFMWIEQIYKLIMLGEDEIIEAKDEVEATSTDSEKDKD